MMDYINLDKVMIKSKILKKFYLWFLWMMICEIGLLTAILKIFKNNEVYTVKLLFIVLLLILIILLFLVVIKEIKYLIVTSEKNQIKYYSILHPFGKKLTLSDYEYKIKTTEFSIQGDYEVIHLVNKKGYTAFKISGLFYKNFKEIDNAIQLKRIHNYKFNWKLYLKLIFTGKMKVEKE